MRLTVYGSSLCYQTYDPQSTRDGLDILTGEKNPEIGEKHVIQRAFKQLLDKNIEKIEQKVKDYEKIEGRNALGRRLAVFCHCGLWNNFTNFNRIPPDLHS